MKRRRALARTPNLSPIREAVLATMSGCGIGLAPKEEPPYTGDSEGTFTAMAGGGPG